ncbi:hypothetical protein PanWU01x14_350100 [Parasponia andersonii]|uniref:Uncharacterized protein n=1 Tax=Parasponia andersonii TaxID=3476 RepID=A0A2P5AB29_PARAD|nr:hypothetical protein PanWU01x14_350100 [Parasponia andersonii]
MALSVTGSGSSHVEENPLILIAFTVRDLIQEVFGSDHGTAGTRIGSGRSMNLQSTTSRSKVERYSEKVKRAAEGIKIVLYNSADTNLRIIQ